MSLAINKKFYAGASKEEILASLNSEKVKQFIKTLDEIDGVRDERYFELDNQTRPCPLTGHLPVIIQSWEPVLLSREEKNNLEQQ
jgi:hypothetical protein